MNKENLKSGRIENKEESESMMNKVRDELKDKGYKAELVDLVKNGTREKALVIKEKQITPAFTSNFFDENATVGENAERVLAEFKKTMPYENKTDELTSPEFIFHNIRIGLQRANNVDDEEKIIKKPSRFKGIEEYLLVIKDEVSYKLPMAVVRKTGIDLKELWWTAYENTIKNSKSVTMQEALGIISSGTKMTVLTNESKVKGASAVINHELLKKVAKDYKCKKLIMLPSSIHEVIVIPCEENTDLELYSHLVRECNKSVDPKEILSDRAYMIEI